MGKEWRYLSVTITWQIDRREVSSFAKFLNTNDIGPTEVIILRTTSPDERHAMKPATVDMLIYVHKGLPMLMAKEVEFSCF